MCKQKVLGFQEQGLPRALGNSRLGERSASLEVVKDGSPVGAMLGIQLIRVRRRSWS